MTAALIVVFGGDLSIRCLGLGVSGYILMPGWCALPLTLLGIVGVTNAINLADGLDGLAGGICMLSFMCIAFLAFQGGNLTVALMAISAVWAIIGFLRFNTFPATVFMGDAGSQLLGFLAISLAIRITQTHTPLSPALPLLLLGLPILDTAMVMVERLSKGRSPFVADKNHMHHKVMRLGLYHSEAVLAIYLLHVFLVMAAYLFRFFPEAFLVEFYAIFGALVLGSLTWACRSGWQVIRHRHLFDRVVKGRLKVLRDGSIPVMVSFRAIEIGMPLLLMGACFQPAVLPVYFRGLALGLAIVLMVLRQQFPLITLSIIFCHIWNKMFLLSQHIVII